MRHQVRGKKLSRDSGQRKALFKSLINSLVTRGQIKTTESKAKAVRPLVEKLITKGKKGTLNSRRLIASFLQNKKAVNKIVDELGPLFEKRPGGYTRIIRLGQRLGDKAMMVKLELVEKPAEKTKTKESVKPETKTRRTPLRSPRRPTVGIRYANKNDKKK